MRAFTPPRAALRGGNQSEDSLAISRRIFKPSPVLCLFAGSHRLSVKEDPEKMIIHLHPLGPGLLPGVAETVGRRFRNMVSLSKVFVDVVGREWRPAAADVALVGAK